MFADPGNQYPQSQPVAGLDDLVFPKFLFIGREIEEKVDFIEVSYGSSIREAVGWFAFWIIASAVSVLIPYGLGALVPVVGILVGLGDIESTTTGPAIMGAFFTAFLAWAINDQIGMMLYFIAGVLGIVSLFK